jgi:hypothetical protein
LSVFALLFAASSVAQTTGPPALDGGLGTRLEHTEFLYEQAKYPDGGPARPIEALSSAPKPKLRTGQHVRIWTEQYPVHGRVLTADADHVLLDDPSRSTSPYGTASIQWSRIQSAEIRTSGAGRGAIVGAVLFGALGAAAGALFSADMGENADAGAVVGGAAGGALIGAGLGAAIGSAFKGWKQVYPPR